MIFCQKCGTQMSDDSKYCSKCGCSNEAVKTSNDLNDISAVKQKKIYEKKLLCPNCKSYNFSSSTESSVSGAFTTGGGNFAVTSVSNKHQTFWLCHDCGMKFRNIYDFEEQLKKDKKEHKVGKILTPIFFILCVAFLVLGLILKAKENPDEFIDMMGIYSVYAFCAAAVLLIFFISFLIVGISDKSKIKKQSEELDALKKKCFD